MPAPPTPCTCRAGRRVATPTAHGKADIQFVADRMYQCIAVSMQVVADLTIVRRPAEHVITVDESVDNSTPRMLSVEAPASWHPPDEVIAEVHLVPLQAVRCAVLECMVVVVPPVAEHKEGHHPVVARLVARSVGLLAPDVHG